VKFIVLWESHIEVEHESLSIKQLLDHVQSGQWRVLRRDSWRYDEQVISALRSISSRRDVELIDPTGLLGGSTHPDLHPVSRPNTGSLTSRRSVMPPAPKRKAERNT
jgi:hypothetical protein